MPNPKGGLHSACVLCVTASAADVWLPPNCVRAVERRYCVNPTSMGPDNPNCKQVEKVSDCLECEPCYERDTNNGFEYFNNETGERQKTFGCAAVEFTNVPNATGYKYRTCDGSATFEYTCDPFYSNTKHYYPISDTPTCKATATSSGSFTFSSCKGCRICNEETESWKLVSGATGYQQMYKNVFKNTADNYCTAVAQGSYRCDKGYYGTPTSSTSGCTKCPTLAEAGITVLANPEGVTLVSTTTAGATKITECYATSSDINTRATLSDGTGTFEWTYDPDIESEGRCFYSL